MPSNTPFPEFKTTGDEKHHLETYIEDLIDYCTMQNWYDSSKEIDEAKWTKPDKAMACLRPSLSPAARMVYKYSLDLSEADLKKPHSVVNALREYYGSTEMDIEPNRVTSETMQRIKQETAKDPVLAAL